MEQLERITDVQAVCLTVVALAILFYLCVLFEGWPWKRK